MYCNKPADQLIQIIRKQIVHLRHHKKRGCNPLEQYFKLLNCYILFFNFLTFFCDVTIQKSVFQYEGSIKPGGEI